MWDLDWEGDGTAKGFTFHQGAWVQEGKLKKKKPNLMLYTGQNLYDMDH